MCPTERFLVTIAPYSAAHELITCTAFKRISVLSWKKRRRDPAPSTPPREQRRYPFPKIFLVKLVPRSRNPFLAGFRKSKRTEHQTGIRLQYVASLEATSYVSRQSTLTLESFFFVRPPSPPTSLDTVWSAGCGAKRRLLYSSPTLGSGMVHNNWSKLCRLQERFGQRPPSKAPLGMKTVSASVYQGSEGSRRRSQRSTESFRVYQRNRTIPSGGPEQSRTSTIKLCRRSTVRVGWTALTVRPFFLWCKGNEGAHVLLGCHGLHVCMSL